MNQESVLGVNPVNNMNVQNNSPVLTRREYLEKLRGELSQMSRFEVEDIIRDQEEYIHDAISSGRLERDVMQSLGEPKAFATNILAGSKIQKADQATNLKDQIGGTMNAVFAILALAPLNLIFVLGPFMACSGFLVAGWSIAMGLFAAAIGFIGLFFMKLVFISAGFWAHLSTFFFAAGVVGLSLISFVLITYLTKWFLKATIAYLKWNLNFIQARK